MATSMKVLIGLSAAALVASAIVVVLVSVHMSHGDLVLDPVCNDDDPCHRGVSTTIGGSKFCAVQTLAPGSRCRDECHETGTATACDADGLCQSADPTKCLGYCQIHDPDPSFTVGEYESDDCVDKLTFKDFFVWNTPASSGDVYSWIFYSDTAGECDPVKLGCVWFGTRIRFIYDNIVNFWAPTGAELSCLEYLNMTNDECIEAREQNLSGTIATEFWRDILTDYDPEFDFSDRFFEASVCWYSYKCVRPNATYFTDPFWQQGAKKRSVAGTAASDTERFLRVANKTRASMSATVAPHLMNQIRAADARRGPRTPATSDAALPQQRRNLRSPRPVVP